MSMIYRPRRLRVSEGIRSLVRETRLTASDLVYPIFVVPGTNIKKEIAALPGNFHLSPDKAVELARETYAAGIPAVLVFGLPEYKDECGSSAWDMKSPVQLAIAAIKQAVPELVVISDVCLCEYTSHGHCGLIHDQKVDNDATLPLIAKVALSHAQAGADMVAPSDMMDGRVAAIRSLLDDSGYSDISIMAYSAKYASAYYGPFREAADSTPQFGDRKSYQMDPANAREALKEVAFDIEEGADIVMVKPALAYLDIVRQVKDEFMLPLAVYNVSGEYAMVKAAAAQGLIDEPRLVIETLTGMKRAGADIIITYHALDAVKWL
ncbi:porphobilinogen synthase [Sporomusa acidovorans]|uniref:Delta-aminolevulinic acid dehydratase n=1 Tax=Sporomusa acidovorans (strain ATCC 49682 / DSM 3132 / Mol) TaxID=1123286 RepID=A0ABZ3J992_SPOA4|nr:porphobilinogen synthase [Sporomusa acidovorans]OZC22924.1 delta-aminolevulinic acid dehydratase [Sporomusa acidovorans DSM 3132]SDE94994.1 porphobilinogen synthase [Sporomusa acidovorans]